MPDPLAWDTLDSRVAYSCPGFDVVHDDVRLPDGTETDFDYLSEPESVVVIPFTGDSPGPGAGGGPDARADDGDGPDARADDSDTEVVVIEEWRQAVGRVNRGLPAGNVEPGDDDLAEAARRELREETGHEADAVEHLVSVEPANGLLDAVNHYFVATGCAPTAEQDLDENETIRVETTAWRDLRDAVLAGELRGGKAVVGVCYYELAR